MSININIDYILSNGRQKGNYFKQFLRKDGAALVFSK